MENIISSIKRESKSVRNLISKIDENIWNSATTFKSWTPNIILSHLLYFDRMTIYSINNIDRFNQESAFLFQIFSNESNSLNRAEKVLERLSINTQESMIDAWVESNNEMTMMFSNIDPEHRCQWFGPDMSARMFMTARYMETWSHVQAIYDLTKNNRNYSDDIKHIVEIGVKTLKWSFRNRKLTVPDVFPYLELKSPSDAIWTYNESSEIEMIRGKASDFCHVVTQNRHVEDTNLEVNGKISQHWMTIAQCFAGEPEDPPKPGTRK